MEEILTSGSVKDLNEYIKERLYLDNCEYEFDYSEEFPEECDNTSYYYNSSEFALKNKNYDMAIYLVNNFDVKCSKRVICKYGNTDFIIKTKFNDFDIFDLCQYENLELLDYLLTINLNYLCETPEKQTKFINNKNNFGETPLIIACQYGNYNTVLKLFNSFSDKIDINIKCNDGYNAFSYAITYVGRKNSYDIIKFLLEKNIDIIPNKTYMENFIMTNNIQNKIFDLIIEKIPDFYKYCEASNKIHYYFQSACKYSLLNIIKYYLEYKDHFNITDEIIHSGLDFAIDHTDSKIYDAYELVKLLCENYNCKLNEKHLEISIKRSEYLLIDYILDQSINPDIIMNISENKTALYWILVHTSCNDKSYQINIIDKMIEKGANMYHLDKFNKYPIYYTLDLDFIKIFIKNKFDINKIGYQNGSYLDYLKKRYEDSTLLNYKEKIRDILYFLHKENNCIDYDTIIIKINSIHTEKIVKLLKDNNIDFNL